MANTELATAYIALVPSMKGAQGAIANAVVPGATSAGDTGGTSMGQALLGGLKKFAAPIAVLAAGFGVKKIVSESTDAFNQLASTTKTLARIAGGTTEQVSALAGGMRMAGLDSDKTQVALTMFSKNVGNANDGGEKAAAMAAKLGTNFLDASGNIKPMSELLPSLADRFQSMPNGAEKTALAMQLFGRSGAQMIPFLNNGAAGIEQFTDKAKSMGLVLDDASMSIWSKARVSMREYSAAVQGAKASLGQDLVPVITAVSNVSRQMLIPVLQATSTFLLNNRDRFLEVAGTAQKFADRTGSAITGLLTLFTKGDFTPSLGAALGVEEDSPVIAVLLRTRDVATSVIGAVKGAFASVGPTLSGVFDGVSGAAASVLPGVLAGLAPIGQAFSALLPQLAPLVPQLMSVFSAFNPLSLVMHAILPVLPQLAGVVGTLVSSLAGALGPALTALVPAITQVVSVLSGTLSTTLATLIPVVSQIAVMIAGALGGAITALVPVIVQLMPVVSQIVAILGTLLGSVIQMLAPVLVQVIGLVLQLLPPLMSLLPPIMTVVQALVPIVALIGQLISVLLPPILQLLMAIIEPVLGLITPLVNLLVPILVTLAGYITDFIVPALTQFISYITALTANVAPVVTAIAGGLVNAIVSLIQWVASAASAVGSFTTNAVGAVAGFAASVGKHIGDAIAFFVNLPATIIGVFASAGQWLFDAGKNMITGLLDGVKSLASTIGSFFLNLLPGWIVGPFKAALGIHSPSTVFAGIGQDTGRGYVIGVQSMRSQIESAVTGMVSIPVVPDLYTAPVNPVQSAGNTSTAGSGTATGQSLTIVGNLGYDPAEIFDEWERAQRRSALRANIVGGDL